MGRPTNKISKSKTGDHKKNEKVSHGEKTRDKKKSIESAANTRDKKKTKPRSRNNSKEKRNHSLSKEVNRKKTIVKQEEKKNDHKRETKINNNNNNNNNNNINNNFNRNTRQEDSSCFSCLCCCGNEDEWQNEILLEEERRLAERKKRLAEEEKKKKEEEEEARKKEEEEEKKKEAEREKEREKLLEEEREAERKRAEEEMERKKTEAEEAAKREEEEEEQKKQTVLRKIEVKPKHAPKKPQIQFRTPAAAPAPPPESACYGPLPDVRNTVVSLSEGAYLIYKEENGGQLEIQYSKKAILGKGVLAYIGSDNIPSFYFKKMDGKQVLLKDAAKLISSNYIKDRISYYEKWIEFIKLQSTLQGTLYMLPAFDAQPPAKVDVIFYNSEQNKLQFVELEKPVKMWGDYVFVVQHGLDIFKKNEDSQSILSYVDSYGAMACL